MDLKERTRLKLLIPFGVYYLSIELQQGHLRSIFSLFIIATPIVFDPSILILKIVEGNTIKFGECSSV